MVETMKLTAELFGGALAILIGLGIWGVLGEIRNALNAIEASAWRGTLARRSAVEAQANGHTRNN